MLEWLKPVYHFTPPCNWMNDPNGLCMVDGQYHLFYQHNPNADVWGDIHWGHAVSPDLIHWKRLPIAFGPDTAHAEKHCYSGSIALQDGRAWAFYTSVGEGERNPETGAQQWAAYSDDGLKTWHRYEHNPILPAEINGDLNVTFWRDPFVWREKDGLWYAVLGGTLNGQHGCMLLYRSPDLTNWTFMSVLHQSQEDRLLECPNLIRIGDRYVLLCSPLREIQYRVGRLNERFEFVTESEGVFDGGSGRHGFYAPNTYMNLPGERRVVIGWMSDKGREEQPMIRGWSGAQSLPRELRLEGSRLLVDFAQECCGLRKERIRDFSAEHPSACGHQIEICLTLEHNGRGRMEMELLSDGREKTRLVFDAEEGTMRLEREQSTLLDHIDVMTLIQPVPHRGDGKTNLQVFVDGSIVEVCADHAVMLSGRVYPSSRDACRHTVKVTGGMRILEAEAWLPETIFPAGDGQ